MAAGGQLPLRREPAASTAEEVQEIYRWFDLVIAVLLVFLFMALYHIYTMLTVGDWDFWTDWKDNRWWITLTPFLEMPMPAAALYIFWSRFRLPIAGTLLAVSLVLATWLNRYVNMHGWAYFPLNFVWPATLIPCGIVLDCTLALTQSYLLTGIVGGFAWGIIFYLANWPLITPFLQPTDLHGVMASLADLQGYHYIRTGTPEYLRIINRGTLRTFGQEPVYLSLALAGFASVLTYGIGLFIGWAFTKTQFAWFKRV